MCVGVHDSCKDKKHACLARRDTAKVGSGKHLYDSCHHVVGGRFRRQTLSGFSYACYHVSVAYDGTIDRNQASAHLKLPLQNACATVETAILQSYCTQRKVSGGVFCTGPHRAQCVEAERRREIPVGFAHRDGLLQK